MLGSLGTIDIGILVLYGCVLIGMGLYYKRKCRTAEEFMVAGRSIPAWAAGLAVMSTYTSSISYIATPGKAYSITSGCGASYLGIIHVRCKGSGTMQQWGQVPGRPGT